jgi:exosome complex component RRP42
MAAVKKELVVEELRRSQLLELLAKGKRLDGRPLLDYRPVSVEVGVIEKAEGSARVNVGNTQVIAGVKVALGTPFPDRPDEGLLVVNAEVLPVASPYAEPGPPDENAIELARVVDRGIRASEVLDLSKLALVPGKKVQAVFVDVSVLDVDGNLFDATSFAVVAALTSARAPEYGVTGNGEVEARGARVPLPAVGLTLTTTLARIGDVMIVDPTAEEETVMDARITFATDDEGNLCAGQKGNPGAFSLEQIMLAAETARTKGNEIRELIRGALSRA